MIYHRQGSVNPIPRKMARKPQSRRSAANDLPRLRVRNPGAAGLPCGPTEQASM
jgi:hypothetical protein